MGKNSELAKLSVDVRRQDDFIAICPASLFAACKACLIAIFALTSLSQSAFSAEHSGNIYRVGEDVRIALPSDWTEWRAIDIDNKVVRRGQALNGVAPLGELPVGYYEVRTNDRPDRITAAMLPKIIASETTPVAIDVAASWFYADPEQIRDACRLCKMAGVTWVRDRSSWPELETARRTWANETRYERAMRIQHEMGLKVLQVNHISPPWATNTASRFVEDLRDVHSYYRGLARRWRGLADAIEPWNEPDIELFGGHTGCEIASFHKAAALGLRAGNPEQPICGTVFALDRPETLEEFGANEVYPYFDRYNLHHYIGLDRYPQAYARHRAVSGGRPLWTTEFNLMVNWADEKTHEPSDEDLRVQGYRVAKVFSCALHEGVEKAFYFILGHYVERTLQYGLVHTDLTPRPAYVAFAAVGRFLNDAKPIGRVDFGNDKLKGYGFSTVVDGVDCETIVAWSEMQPTKVPTGTVQKMYDYLGRNKPLANQVLLTREPVFFILPPGGSKQFKIEPPPVKAKRLDGDMCPVVLQLIGDGDEKQSAFLIDQSKELRLVAYNFADEKMSGTFTVDGAAISARDIVLAPGEREERAIRTNGAGNITARLNLGQSREAIVSAQVTDKRSSD
jgi:hypothetical protein